MNKFKVGDLVELASGSPPCMVTAIKGDAVVFIAWNRDGTELETELPATCLRMHRVQRKEA